MKVWRSSIWCADDLIKDLGLHLFDNEKYDGEYLTWTHNDEVENYVASKNWDLYIFSLENAIYYKVTHGLEMTELEVDGVVLGFNDAGDFNDWCFLEDFTT